MEFHLFQPVIQWFSDIAGNFLELCFYGVFFFNLLFTGFLITMFGPMLVTDILPAVVPGRLFAEEVEQMPLAVQVFLGQLLYPFRSRKRVE